MNILITGGTGFIGRGLCPMFLREGHYLKIITRNPKNYITEQAKNQKFIGRNANLTDEMLWADVVINLAGENLFGQRWTDEVKDEIYASRIETTRQLIQAIESATEPPEVMISGSAVGYYGGRGADVLDEQDKPGNDFLAKLCVDWEQASQPAKDQGVRLVTARTGIVLEKGGGVLQQMLPPFQFFVGGPIGRGTQFVPWIHRYDFCRAFDFFLQNKEVEGAFNLCAPNPVTMHEFAAAIAEVLSRPSFFRVPEWLLKIVLGEAAEPVLQSLRVKPKRLQQSGFDFRFPYIREALSDIL